MRRAPEWLKPLDESIEHWERVVEGEDTNIGRLACALCREYNDPPVIKLDDMVRLKCGGCPVREKTGKPTCRGSPYARLAEHLYMAHDETVTIHCEECAICKTFSRAVLEFLKGLRPVEVE